METAFVDVPIVPNWQVDCSLGESSCNTVRSVVSIHPSEYIDVELNPWGVAFGLRTSEMFWFNTPEDLVQFLCLDGDTYITAVSREKKEPIVAALVQQLDRSLNALDSDDDNLCEVVSEIRKSYDGRVPLRWYGQFSKLCSSDAEFPQLLRSIFFKATGLHACKGKEGICEYDFAQYLLGPR
jgi:hypothetical protein